MFAPRAVGPVVLADDLQRSRVHQDLDREEPGSTAVVRVRVGHDELPEPLFTLKAITGKHSHDIGVVYPIPRVDHQGLVR